MAAQYMAKTDAPVVTAILSGISTPDKYKYVVYVHCRALPIRLQFIKVSFIVQIWAI